MTLFSLFLVSVYHAIIYERVDAIQDGGRTFVEYVVRSLWTRAGMMQAIYPVAALSYTSCFVPK